MKERPILFSGEMVRAVLDGHKTQTRRTVKDVPGSYCFAHISTDLGYESSRAFAWAGFRYEGLPDNASALYWKCPYGQPGDRLWVREAWATDASLNDKAPSQFSKWPVIYVADNKVNMCGALHGNTGGKIRQSIFMPRWASRITLEITSVRVERLQEISEADAQAEGVKPIHFPHGGSTLHPHFHGFKTLWGSINGKRAPWQSNPWVWVVEFKQLGSAA